MAERPVGQAREAHWASRRRGLEESGDDVYVPAVAGQGEVDQRIATAAQRLFDILVHRVVARLVLGLA